MSLETAQYIHQLNSSNPSGSDRLKDGDDHIRMIKGALKATFPGFAGPLDPSVTHSFLSGLAAFLVPVGAITLWHGLPAAVPEGWALCNGSSVPKSDGTGSITTPDLRGRVPVGVSATYPLGTTFGAASRTVTTAAGGAHNHTAVLPAHQHAAGTIAVAVANAPTGATLRYSTKADTAGGGSGKTLAVPPDGNAGGTPPGLNDSGHTHGATVSGSTASGGGVTITTATADAHTHTATVDVVQPSIALHFIIKV